MSAFVDRLANAAMHADWANEREAPPNGKIANYYTMVRAILAEARVAVTGDMLEAMADVQYGPTGANGARDAFQAAIDEALAPDGLKTGQERIA